MRSTSEPAWIALHRSALMDKKIEDIVESAQQDRQKVLDLAKSSRSCFAADTSGVTPTASALRWDELSSTTTGLPHCAPKIYFCMRTHSQVSQFAKEALKVNLKDVTGICIGSRLSMCINEKVNKYRNIDLINKKCMDLVKSIHIACLVTEHQNRNVYHIYCRI